MLILRKKKYTFVMQDSLLISMQIQTLHIKSIISLALLLLLAWVPNLEAKRSEDVTIPFQLINGMIIMNLEVDGKQGAFLLDTGADAILIDGIPENTSGQEVSTLGGEVAVEMTELEYLKIGSLEQYGVAAQVMSLTLLEQNLGIDLFGVIGGAYFMPRSIFMDFTTSTITISDKPFGKKAVHGLSTTKFKMVHGIPVVSVKIGGKSYNFAMDSGASTHFIHDGLLKTMTGLTKQETSTNIISANHISKEVYRYQLAELKLGKVTFENQDCLPQNFDEINAELKKPIAGILSLSAFAKEKIIIDFKKKKMYF